jgi:hypothetical protein
MTRLCFIGSRESQLKKLPILLNFNVQSSAISWLFMRTETSGGWDILNYPLLLGKIGWQNRLRNSGNEIESRRVWMGEAGTRNKLPDETRTGAYNGRVFAAGKPSIRIHEWHPTCLNNFVERNHGF